MLQGCSHLTWEHRQWRSPPQEPLGLGSRTGVVLLDFCVKKEWKQNRGNHIFCLNFSYCLNVEQNTIYDSNFLIMA